MGFDKNKRKLLQAASATVAIGTALNFSASPVNANECDPDRCTDYSIFGEKPEMSREEFNALASEISNGVISEMRETEGLVLNEESIKKIEFNIHRELERLTQKYRTLTQ